MEKSRSVTSAGRRLLCQWRCYFNIHLFITKSESPGSSTCGPASIHSVPRSDRGRAGPEQNGAKQKWSKGPAHRLFKKNECCQRGRRLGEERGPGSRAALEKAEDGKMGTNLPIDLQTSRAGLQWFHRTPAQNQTLLISPFSTKKERSPSW